MKAKFLLLVGMFFLLFIGSTKLQAQANANNIYDEVGVVHNNVLATFLNEYSKERINAEQMDEKGLYNYICRNANLQRCDFVHQVRQSEIMQVTKSMDLSETANYLNGKGYITDIVAQYVAKIDGIIKDNMPLGYNAVYTAFMSLENEILRTANLKKEEQMVLLQACAVGRHSCKFWYDLSVGETSYKGVEKAPTTEQATTVAGEDVKGAISGAVAGAVVGAAAGGIGALPGAKVGAIAGGLGASVADAAVKLWDWFWS